MKFPSTVAFVLLTFYVESRATTIFSEDFASGLGGWTGKTGGAHNAAIVADPFDSANRVLSFTGLGISGDVFSADLLSVSPSVRTVVSFDYLGLLGPGSVSGNLGGFLGISLDLLPEGGDAAWIAGTEPSAVNGMGFTGIELLDDGQWHRYQVDITSGIRDNNISGIHLMLEDWQDAGGVPGDAYFDNIQVSVVSIPDTGSTATLLILVIFCVRAWNGRADSATTS